jgi:DNA primase
MNDDMPWVNLTQQEVDELRKQKQELTEYGKQKLKKLMMNQEPYPDEMFEEAERREAENKRPFYRFFAIDYFGTGEGRSYWLKICRNYPPIDGKDRELERFAKFIGEGAEYYMHGLEQPTEQEFMEKYARLIPEHITKMISYRDQPFFTWETHFHYNYS